MSNWLTKLKKRKREKKKFACLTAYDATMARVISQQGVECLLVGDSLGMVIQGHPNTVSVTLDDIVYHTKMVGRGNCGSLLMADIPIGCSYDLRVATESALRLMRAGAEIVKFEVDETMLEIMASLSHQGIPLCLHLGLRPQQIARLGSYRVQGRTEQQAESLIELAKKSEAAGANMLLLECVVAQVAEQITQAVAIPVIGIGCGRDTDGQVLVSQDMLGLSAYSPSFAKDFMAETQSVADAVALYHKQVLEGTFPSAEHWYETKP